MITNKLKSAKDSWKLSYEDAINLMKEEAEEARDEYNRLSDLLLEAELDEELSKGWGQIVHPPYNLYSGILKCFLLMNTYLKNKSISL